MERIKDALAKAKSKPDRLVDPQPAFVDKPHSEVVIGRKAARVPYTQVRTVSLDRLHLESKRIVTLDKSDPRCSYFDILRTRIVQGMVENDWHTLAITSPDSECGKTVTAINLALSMAQQPGRTVILIDFDLRRPNVGRTLGLSMDKSLADYFHGLADIEEVIVNPELAGFFVLPNHTALQNASEILTSQTTSNLIEDLRARYPDAIIIFDLPPVLAFDDVLAFLPKVDSVMMVAAAHKTRIPDIEECERRFASCNYFGLVLNKVDETFQKQDAYHY